MKFKHLDDVEMTYIQHFRTSARWAGRMAYLAYCAFFHAIYPDLFTSTVSTHIKKYNEEIKNPKKH